VGLPGSHDPVEPGAGGAVAPEAFDARPGLDPHFLGGVPGVLVAQDANRDPLHEIRVLVDEPGEGLDAFLGRP
jgi:hypothetical protein